jgi:hypothetical protein
VVRLPGGSRVGLAGDDVEVADDGDPAKVEEVLAGAAVAGAAALPVADVGEGVLDRDALAELRAPSWGLLALAQLGEQRLVGVDNDAAPVAAGGAAFPQRAGGAGALFGKCTVLPGWKPMLTQAGQVRSAARYQSRG